jgi:predicted PurR-regulated permease PerM
MDTPKNYNTLIRQILFVLILIVLGLILFDQLTFFIGSMLGAITLYVVFRNLQFRLVEKRGWKTWLAALMITLMSLIILGAVGWGVGKVVSSEIPSINAQSIIQEVNDAVDNVNEFVGFEVVSPDALTHSEGVITKVASSVLNATYSFVANIFMMLVVLYFMLSAGRKMECKMSQYSPFSGRSLSLLKHEIKNMIYSNAVGIPVIMVVQTIAASLLYYLIGLDNYFFWGFLTAICGLVPLVGTGLIYIPMGVYFAITGHPWIGVIIVLYGVLVISNVDNLIRILLLGKYAHTHPLIVIFGVIIGIPMFGFWGIIFGPLFISGFMLLIKIYFVEYGLIDAEHPDVTCVTGSRKKTIRGLSSAKGKKQANKTSN